MKTQLNIASIVRMAIFKPVVDAESPAPKQTEQAYDGRIKNRPATPSKILRKYLSSPLGIHHTLSFLMTFRRYRIRRMPKISDTAPIGK